MTKRTSKIEVAKILLATSLTISSRIESDCSEFFGVIIPLVFEGTSLSFQVSIDGITFQDLYDTTNSKVTLTVTTSRSYDLPASLRAWPYFRIVSNAAVGADRFLSVSMKG
jgi:hypothetical protein